MFPFVSYEKLEITSTIAAAAPASVPSGSGVSYGAVPCDQASLVRRSGRSEARCPNRVEFFVT